MAQGLKNLPILNKFSLLKILKNSNRGGVKSPTHIFNKSLTIVKGFLGFYVMVYKGNLFRRVHVTRYVLGYKFGEFTHTRKPFNYPIVKKKKKNLRR
jgi:ribosomal protein S19